MAPTKPVPPFGATADGTPNMPGKDNELAGFDITPTGACTTEAPSADAVVATALKHNAATEIPTLLLIITDKAPIIIFYSFRLGQFVLAQHTSRIISTFCNVKVTVAIHIDGMLRNLCFALFYRSSFLRRLETVPCARRVKNQSRRQFGDLLDTPYRPMTNRGAR